MSESAKNEKQKYPNRFQPGHPGGPGRPVGSRNSATIALQQLLDGQGELVIQKVLEKAMEGDSTAMKLVVDRLVPVCKERSINISLPKIGGAADIVSAIAAIMQSVADGSITPSEGGTLAGLVEAQRKSIETLDLSRRVELLERQSEEKE